MRSPRRGGLQRRPATCCGIRRDAWAARRGGEATEGAELGDEHERALAGRPERPRSLGGRVVDPSHREGAGASDGGRPCLGDSWGLRARGWSVLAVTREVGMSRTTGAAGGTLKAPPEPGSGERAQDQDPQSEVCRFRGDGHSRRWSSWAGSVRARESGGDRRAALRSRLLAPARWRTDLRRGLVRCPWTRMLRSLRIGRSTS